MDDITKEHLEEQNSNNLQNHDLNNPAEIEFNEKSLKGLSGWATFRAIFDIVIGALTCLGIITAAIGIPMIFAGVKLLNSVEELNKLRMTNDTRKIPTVLDGFRKYFKINGILTIVGICLYIILIIVYGILIVKFLPLLRNHGYMNQYSGGVGSF